MLNQRGSRVRRTENGKVRSEIMDLYNETAVNVASLLQEQVGSSRTYRFGLDALALDEDLVARDIIGKMRLTRLSDEVLANVEAAATVTLTCLRCLELYDQPVNTRFQEEFRVVFDVRSGRPIEGVNDDERFSISGLHELDIVEPLRQELIVALPMRPDCGTACPGPPSIANDGSTDTDDRFAALAALLNGNSEE